MYILNSHLAANFPTNQKNQPKWPKWKNPPKWQKNDLVSGGHSQVGSLGGLRTGWIGSAPVQISGCGLDGALS